MTKNEALKMAHKTFMQLNERHPRRDNGEGCFDKELKAINDALEQPSAQEPVAWMELKEDAGYTEITVWQEPVSKKSIPLYTHPAPSWQGLSDDEIDAITCVRFEERAQIRAIEQALKEKNNV